MNVSEKPKAAPATNQRTNEQTAKFTTTLHDMHPHIAVRPPPLSGPDLGFCRNQAHLIQYAAHDVRQRYRRRADPLLEGGQRQLRLVSPVLVKSLHKMSYLTNDIQQQHVCVALSCEFQIMSVSWWLHQSPAGRRPTAPYLACNRGVNINRLHGVNLTSTSTEAEAEAAAAAV